MPPIIFGFSLPAHLVILFIWGIKNFLIRGYIKQIFWMSLLILLFLWKTLIKGENAKNL